MTFAIITHVDHSIKNEKFYSYAPYVREMDIWGKYVDRIELVAPISKKEISTIYLAYSHSNITISTIPSISLTSFLNGIKAIFALPLIIFKIARAMSKADHIHLRCPGNIGLIGCLVQVFFPKKSKTAKYAGNWDPKSKQPVSYRFQKWLLSNTFLTRNMQVLVYGEWPVQTKNIKPFFTASYPREKIPTIHSREFKAPFRFLFVGSLSPGKRPVYTIQLVEKLIKKGIGCSLDLYGEGPERIQIENFLQENQLSDAVKLHGNKDSKELEKAYKESDFLILPSQSEGWPKAVAEAMFWGAIPIVTKISCVPWMLEEGKRGILIEAQLEEDVQIIEDHLLNLVQLKKMSRKAQEWSHQYTLDDFENEIKEIL